MKSKLPKPHIWRFLLPALALVLLVFQVATMYREYVAVLMVKPQEVLKIGDTQAVVGEITKDTGIEQEFLLKNQSFTGFDLYFATYGRKNSSHLKVRLEEKESGKQAGSWAVSCEDLKDNAAMGFRLPDRLTVKEKTRYVLKISSDDAVPGNAVTVFRSDKRSENKSGLFVGGKSVKGKMYVLLTDGNQAYLKTYFIGIAVTLILMMVLLWVMASVLKWKPHRLFLTAGIGLGILYIFILPPYSAPDEQAHIYTAYYFSNELMGVPAADEKGRTVIREADRLMGIEQMMPDSHTYGIVAAHLFDKDRGGEMAAFPEGPLPGVPWFVYTPQILGITLARWMNLGNVGLLMMGRIFALAFYLACGFFAVKVIPFAKAALTVVLLLPMSMELAGSFSYDSFVNAVSFLFVAYCLYLAFGKETVKKRDWVVPVALAALLAPCKIVYVLLCFLVFLIPWKKSASRMESIIGKASVFAGGFLSMAVVRAATMTEYLTRQENTLSYMDGQGYTLAGLLEKPMTIIQMYYDSFRKFGDFYLETMLGGQLGWLDVKLPIVLLILILAILLVSVLKKEQEPQWIGPREKWLLALVSAGVIGALFMVFTLTWTPLGLDVIQGVQGRYFLPVLPLILLLFRGKNITIKRDMDQSLILGMGLVQFFAVWSIFQTVIQR